MLLPMSIKVGPYDYQVEYVDSFPDGRWGETEHHTLTIRLAIDQAAGQERDTVLHELLHAVWSSMDIGKPKSEEKVVHRLSTGLLAVLRDNPDLVRYFCD